MRQCTDAADALKSFRIHPWAAEAEVPSQLNAMTVTLSAQAAPSSGPSSARVAILVGRRSACLLVVPVVAFELSPHDCRNF